VGADMRTDFVDILKHQLGKPYIWGSNGPDSFDCSGLVVYGLRALGLIDKNVDFSAEDFRKLCVRLENEEPAAPGDFAIYGGKRASHIVVFIDARRVISASGGDSGCTSPEIAKRQNAAIKIHGNVNYRQGLLGVYRNRWLERKPMSELSQGNRLNEPKIAIADGTPPPATQNGSTLGPSVFPQWLWLALVGLVGLAGIVLGLPAFGVVLPPVVMGIAGGIVSLGAMFGIASPGIRKKE
jgi:hypothetical protein